VSRATPKEKPFYWRRFFSSLLEGRDPRQDKNGKKKTAPSFAECAARYIATHKPGWRNPKHAAQWESTLKAYAFEGGWFWNSSHF
jgi:hypothetical protein